MFNSVNMMVIRKFGVQCKSQELFGILLFVVGSNALHMVFLKSKLSNGQAACGGLLRL